MAQEFIKQTADESKVVEEQFMATLERNPNRGPAGEALNWGRDSGYTVLVQFGGEWGYLSHYDTSEEAEAGLRYWKKRLDWPLKIVKAGYIDPLAQQNPEVFQTHSNKPLMSNYEWARGAMSTHLLSSGNMATWAPRLNSKNFKAAVKILKEAASEGHQWAKDLLVEAGVREGTKAKNPPGDVPNTTWRQIPLMTKMRLGARGPIGDKDTLTFAVSIKPGYAYKFSIRLDPSDTYSVTLYKIRKGRTFQEVETVGDIYNDSLGEVLEGMSDREYRRRVAGQ